MALSGDGGEPFRGIPEPKGEVNSPGPCFHQNGMAGKHSSSQRQGVSSRDLRRALRSSRKPRGRGREREGGMLGRGGLGLDSNLVR